MVDRIEILILSSLFFNEDYIRKVLPFIKPEYFSERIESLIFEKCFNFITKYNSLPTKEAIIIQMTSGEDEISDKEYQAAIDLISSLKKNKEVTMDWMLDQTEQFCQDQALHNAVMQTIKIAGGKSKNISKGAIPELMKEALSVSFDPNIGHSYLADFEKRFDWYHSEERKIPFDIKFLNKITGGGLPLKTLTVILAGTAVGKSLAMCHFAASNLMAGYNVLYITLEMSEERTGERIDANLLNLPIENLDEVSKIIFESKINKLVNKTNGELIIKEYPTAMASTTHFRHLLSELHLKKNFVPDIIYIDYLNIASSARLKPGRASSYEYVKAIAEELRGLAVEQNLPIVTATQTNRAGFSSSDLDATDTSESFGVPMTADLMFALITNENLEKMNKLQIQQVKNRYNALTKNKRFLIGIDLAKMRLYDLEEQAQETLSESGQEPETTTKRKDKRGVFDDIEI